MEDKTKKTVAGLTVGAIGVAGAGIVAGNIISDKQEKEISESSIVAEDNSNNDEKVKSAITELTGVSTTTSDNTRTSDTTSTTTIELGNYGMSLEEYRSSKAAASTSTTSEYVGNTSNSTETTVKEDISKTDTTTTTKDSVSDVDIECYELMKDANAYSLRRFDSEYSSLSDALVSTYGVELSDAQKARYDTVAKDTYEAYKKAIAAYESGDMESFRKICNEVLNGKKYLNLDDLVDILSININLQGDYIKSSSNYSISDGKLIIDGITLDSLFPNATYVDQFNVMSLINFYGKDNKSDNRVLDIMQTSIFIIKQATNPTNLTLVENNNVYSYDENVLREKFEKIKSLYNSKMNLDNNSIDDKYGEGFKYYTDMLDLYYTSYNCRVGYFSGSQMKDFLEQHENGIENVKAPEKIEYTGVKYWDSYSLMQDANGYAFDRFNKNYSSLSDALVSTYGVELSDEQKARYDTIMKDTSDIYKKGIAAYESGHVSEFEQICNDVLNSKKYLNLDDLIDILSININSQDHIINNPSNYSISKGKLVIDGANVESLFDVPNYVDHFDVMSYLSMYDGASEDDLRVLNIMQVPIYVANEAVSPTSFSLMVNGTLYAYRNEDLNKRFDDINNYFVENIGLTDFGYEKTDSDVMYYGFDGNSQKQYISSDSEYIRDLSRYLMSFYPSYEKSKDGRVGYFDGEMMRYYLNEFNNNLEKGATK